MYTNSLFWEVWKLPVYRNDVLTWRLCSQARLESEVTLQLNLIKRQQQEIERKKQDLLERQSGLRQETVRPELLLELFQFQQLAGDVKRCNEREDGKQAVWENKSGRT